MSGYSFMICMAKSYDGATTPSSGLSDRVGHWPCRRSDNRSPWEGEKGRLRGPELNRRGFSVRPKSQRMP